MEEGLGRIAPSNKRIVYADEVCAVNDLCVKPFRIPHDAAEPVGYNVFSGEKKITLATDIGHVTDTIRESIEDSDVLLLEANHDVEMLKKGGYPWSLKQRILGENGTSFQPYGRKASGRGDDGKDEICFFGTPQ